MSSDVTTRPSSKTGALRRAIPFMWLAFSAGWAVVIFATDTLTWPLALWVATTLGPLTALERATRASTGPDPS